LANSTGHSARHRNEIQDFIKRGAGFETRTLLIAAIVEIGGNCR
jgi:hypothetical protein